MPLWPRGKIMWFFDLHIFSHLRMSLTVFGYQCSHPLFKGVVFDDVHDSLYIYSSPTVNTLLSITSNCLQWHPGVSVSFKMLEITDCSLYPFFIKYWKHLRNNLAPTCNVIILSYESPLPISLHPRLRQCPEIKDKVHSVLLQSPRVY